MVINIYDNVKTCMGKLVSDNLSFLSNGEKIEFDCIGYTGKNTEGQKSNYQKFLNSLQKGKFEVKQTKFDKGDFCEEFIVVQVTDV